MEIVAESKYIRISPRKVRLVANVIRRLPVKEALEILGATNKRAAKPLLDTLKQGIGNAVNNFKLNKENLVIKEIQIGEGPVFKRWRAVSRGQAHRILKRTSHIKLVLAERAKKEKEPPKKPKIKRRKDGTKG
ncbi:MAG TPA: 50S ribosomal protein L22 [Candidatus Bathyarchaeia archaeon]|nr:50S ribosomal protein L22 [Candidatus Bathyarchaeia archaeon]